MTVKDLIAYLMELDHESEVFVSCEGGCVVDNDITVKQKGNKVILEIE
ncbi:MULTISPECIES: hypothetical protein [Bacillus cereus group]|nr:MULTISPECIES: hypothetical protein [Bacillus cereus group]